MDSKCTQVDSEIINVVFYEAKIEQDYAILAIHDRESRGPPMARSLLGRPLDGIGFSNNDIPDWDTAKFKSHTTDIANITIHINYA